MYISRIYNVYHKDIIRKKGTEQTHLLWSRYIPGMLVRTAYDWNMPGIYTKNIHGIYYMVYPSYILVYTTFIHSICSVYLLYILGIYIAYFWDIQCICFVYIYCIYMYNMRIYSTRWLVLRRRAGCPFHLLHQQPHPSRLDES